MLKLHTVMIVFIMFLLRRSVEIRQTDRNDAMKWFTYRTRTVNYNF